MQCLVFLLNGKQFNTEANYALIIIKLYKTITILFQLQIVPAQQQLESFRPPDRKLRRIQSVELIENHRNKIIQPTLEAITNGFFKLINIVK